MMWLPRWRALAARIEGVVRAAELLAATRYGSDVYSVMGGSVMPEILSIRAQLLDFFGQYQFDIPPAATAALDRFIKHRLFKENTPEQDGLPLVVPLAVIRSELEYLFRDHQEEALSQTELAFAHLRRLVEVDADVRSKWKAAFEAHETRCEKLGAVHLLSHGIWAFKVTGVGASTDLVFRDPIERHAPEVQRTARALVATEWKVVKKPAEAEAKAAVARKQLKLYQRGALAEMTLTSTRFVVLVSRGLVPAPPDLVEGDVTYRHVLIPVEPVAPSKAARAATRTPRRGGT